jgi:tetratricopeptide (TPR) repeat protein
MNVSAFLKHSLVVFLFMAFIVSCQEKEKQDGKQNVKQIETGPVASALLSDTAKVNPLVDSLKTSFKNSEDSAQINILNELAENWRSNSQALALEALKQSELLKSPRHIAGAYCKLGIYYYRKFNFDSANYFIDTAVSIATQNKLGKEKAQALSWKAEVLRQSGERDSSLLLQDQVLELALSINDKQRAAFCLISQGEAHRSKGDFAKAIDCYSKAISYAKEVNDLNKIATCYNSMGDVYRIQNDYPRALDYFNRALELGRQNSNKAQITFCLNSMGDIYLSQRELDKSLKFYTEANKIAVGMGNKLQECISLSGLGQTNLFLKNHDIAIECFDRSIKIAEEIGNTDKIAFALCNIGDIYMQRKDYTKALEHYTRSCNIVEETGNKMQMATCLIDIGQCHFNTNNLAAAEVATKKALDVSKETEVPENIKEAAWLSYQIFEKQKQAPKALEMLKLFNNVKDEISSDEQIKKFAAVEYQAKEAGLKAEQKAKEEQFKAEQKVKEEELKRQKTIRYAFTIGFGLVLILAIVIYRGLRINKKQTKIISAQKKEMEHQKELVEEKNKEIIDSITYAKRLQEAILPPVKMVKQNFPESFVYYKPKDIIAGDFYWMEKIGNTTFFAAADSTGHGVPGAMVSVVCSNALNRAIKEFGLKEPGRILDKTRELVIETFEKSEGEVKDGMDISLLAYEKGAGDPTIKWAGANNPLWYISAGELKEIKATKQPIGKTDNPQPFTSHEIQYSKDMIIYLITDGFADQFGGPKGKKFKYKPLQDILLQNINTPLAELESLLSVTFNDWKGQYDQVDDVTFIGIKI